MKCVLFLSPIENLAFSLCSEVVKKIIFFEKVVFSKTFPFNMGLNSLLNLTCVAHHYQKQTDNVGVVTCHEK